MTWKLDQDSHERALVSEAYFRCFLKSGLACCYAGTGPKSLLEICCTLAQATGKIVAGECTSARDVVPGCTENSRSKGLSEAAACRSPPRQTSRTRWPKSARRKGNLPEGPSYAAISAQLNCGSGNFPVGKSRCAAMADFASSAAVSGIGGIATASVVSAGVTVTATASGAGGTATASVVTTASITATGSTSSVVNANTAAWAAAGGTWNQSLWEFKYGSRDLPRPRLRARLVVTGTGKQPRGPPPRISLCDRCAWEASRGFLSVLVITRRALGRGLAMPEVCTGLACRIPSPR